MTYITVISALCPYAGWEMTSPMIQPAASRIRMRALVIPREHGAWGLLLIPLFTGIAAAMISPLRIWPIFLFALAAVALFWLRTPVESLLGTGSLRAHNPQERRTALVAAAGLAVASSACLGAVMWGGRDLRLLIIGVLAAAAFVLQAILRRLGQKMRMAAQLVGAIGLTSTAPAAYYVGTGNLDRSALALWAANWLFAGNQIHFVQLRIHSARLSTFPEKFGRGRILFLAQPIALLALGTASFFYLIPPLVTVAFVPAVVRGIVWFFRKQQALDVKELGWSEMRQGVVFGILLAIAFIFS